MGGEREGLGEREQRERDSEDSETADVADVAENHLYMVQHASIHMAYM